MKNKNNFMEIFACFFLDSWIFKKKIAEAWARLTDSFGIRVPCSLSKWLTFRAQHPKDHLKNYGRVEIGTQGRLGWQCECFLCAMQTPFSSKTLRATARLGFIIIGPKKKFFSGFCHATVETCDTKSCFCKFRFSTTIDNVDDSEASLKTAGGQFQRKSGFVRIFDLGTIFQRKKISPTGVREKAPPLNQSFKQKSMTFLALVAAFLSVLLTRWSFHLRIHLLTKTFCPLRTFFITWQPTFSHFWLF